MTTYPADNRALAAGTGKPRIVLMGEFSSGKSTLSNLLLGSPILPTQVTATRLPPVHVSYGPPGAFAITHDGEQVAVDLGDVFSLTPDDYRSLHVTMISNTLELCDVLDMPGISDPNMSTTIWDDVVWARDHVVWCTHATQAWRQSEAAMWDRMRPSTAGKDLLLITQIDKLRNPRDRARVQERVEAETRGKFAAVYPVALLEALAAGEDFDRWQASGAQVVLEHLIEMLLREETQADAADAAPMADASAPQTGPQTGPQIDPDRGHSGQGPGHDASNVVEIPLERRSAANVASAAQARSPDHVAPRRVQPRKDKSSQPRPTSSASWVDLLDPGSL